jgi:serine protease Do
MTLASLAVVLALGVSQAGAVATPSDVGRSVAPLVDRVKASVVTIQSSKVIARASREDPLTHYLRERFGLGPQQRRQQTQQGLGSGFIIDKSGIVLTNNHVVAGADQVKVLLSDDRSLDAKVEGTDPGTDVAVIRILKPPADLRPATLGDSDKLRVGDYVLAIGNPLGLGQTVTMGIVSAKNRALGGKIINYADFIQTDAAINQGNSGGPLFNFDGAVIGVNSAILNPAMAMNVGFAIPINLANQIARQILKTGQVQRGYLGVRTQDLTAELARRVGIPFQPGALVNSVEPKSPAEQAGLRANDLIIEVAGRRVDGQTLGRLVASRPPGETLKVTVLRGGKRMDLDVKLIENASLRGARLMGMTVEPLSQEEARELRAQALKVVGVDSRGPASGSMQEGDIIVAIVLGQRTVAASAATLKELDERVKKGGWGRLIVLREGYEVVVNVG